jgi:hypothetical protein
LKFSVALISEKDVRANLSHFQTLLVTFKAQLFSILALILFFIVVILSYLGLEYYLKTRKVPLVAIRSIVTSTINKEIGKAVDLGVVDFSIREGLILEDLVISREEDFSFNTNLLKVKRVTFHVSSFFSAIPHIDRIDFFSPQLTLNNDEALEKTLLEYFKSTKVKEVRFHDTRVSFKKGDLSVLDWKEGWDIRFLRKNGKIEIEYDNGIYWLPNATRVKGEGILSETDTNDFKFFLQWKNYPSEEAPLLVSYLFGTTMQSAVLSGNASWERSVKGEDVIKGDVEFENSNFLLAQFPGYVVNGLRFKENFLFQNNKETRDFSSLDFQLKVEDETIVGKESLLNRKIDFKIDDLEPLSSLFIELSSGEGLPLSGKLRGSLEVAETGEKNKWFKVKGAIGGEDLEWNSDHFNFRNGVTQLNVGDGNSVSLNVKGELFDKPINLDLSAFVDWSRSKKIDETFYYPLTSKSKATLKIRELLAKNWAPLYETWKKDTLEEIKERQEKLIPEEYFYQKKIYKYFLESMNFDLAIVVGDFFPYEGSASSGELKGSVIVKDGRLNTNILLPETGSKLSITSYYATKTPNFSFSLYLNAYPWNRPWTDICGMNILPESINLDYSFASQGSDYYTLSKDARISYALKLERVKVVGKELWIKLNLPEKAILDPLTIDFTLDHYFESDYIRNLSIVSSSIDLKGYAQNKTGFYTYSVYGLIGESRDNWTFTEEENKRCLVK